jgi:hypothetical protein
MTAWRIAPFLSVGLYGLLYGVALVVAGLGVLAAAVSDTVVRLSRNATGVATGRREWGRRGRDA